MKITKNQLRRIIRENLLLENQSHPLDAEVAEMDHNHGKNDVYSALYNALRQVGDEDADEAMMEFEQLEHYGYDTEELIDVLDNYPGLKDKVLGHI